MRESIRRRPVTLIMGRLPARTGGETYNFQIYQELVARGIRVRYVYVGLWQALTVVGLLPFIGPALASVVLGIVLCLRGGLFIVDEHFAGAVAIANWIRHGLRLVGRDCRVVFIVHHMDGYPRKPGWLFKLWQWWRLGMADGVIAVSRATQRDLIAVGLQARRMRVVPPGFNATALHHEGLSPAGSPVPAARSTRAGEPVQFLCVASDSPRKGLTVLLQAAARVAAHPFHLHIVGHLPRTYFQHVVRPLITHLELEHHVTFHGRVDGDTLAALYARADAYVWPSLREGFGIVLLEAMYCRLPIVATRVGAAPDLIEDGINGLLVPPGDDVALAHAMRTLIESPALRDRMGQKSQRRLAYGGYRWSDTREQFLHAIEEFLT